MTGSASELRSIPFLHLITDDGVLERVDFLAAATVAVEAGGSDLVFHLRARGASGRRLYELANQLLPATRAAGGWLLINDRCDVALAAGADGVHLPEHGFPPPTARVILGRQVVLGRSVHLSTELAPEELEVLDFLLAGSLYETRSHPGEAPAGADVVARFAPTGLPVVAIGGITPEGAGDVRRMGAAGIAVVSGVWGSADPGSAVAAYRSAWSSAG